MLSHFLISGTPGVGKTTLIREAIIPYKDKTGGFLTVEIKGPGGERQGFEVIGLPGGGRRVFASKELASPVRLNKYGLDLAAFEEVGVKALWSAKVDPQIELLVIDEIGAMEAESPAFRSLTVECLRDFRKPVLAAIRAQSQPFNAEIDKLPNLRIEELSRANYETLKKKLKNWLSEIFRAT